MARYPASQNERRIAAPDLLGVVTAIFAATGMRPDDAALLAGTLVASDLRGIHSHGVMRVPDYVGKLTREGVDPVGRPRLVREAAAAIRIDGGNSMGQIACAFAMREAIGRARAAGSCAAAVEGSNHCGALDYYALMAAEAGMIGLATTNALPTMAPWGGAERILGINPLAIAIPAGRHPPVVLDIAFGMTARGRIQVYQQKGLALPEGWAMDADGAPTTDPAAALVGLIAPIGAYKGTGLALMTGLLATVLTGASYGTALGSVEDGPVAGADGQFLMAIDLAAFDDPDAVRARTDAALDQIMASRRAAGSVEVLPPGRLEHEIAAEFRRDGIPLNDETLAGLRDAAATLAVDATALG